MVLIKAKCQHIKEALQEQELDLNALLSLTDINHYHSFVTRPLKLKMGSALRLWQELETVRSEPTTATNGSTSQDAICIDDDDEEPQQPNHKEASPEVKVIPVAIHVSTCCAIQTRIIASCILMLPNAAIFTFG